MESYKVDNIEQIVKQVVASLVENQGMESSESVDSGRIACLTGKERIEVQSHRIPEINDDEVLVKVEGCGVCGTDVHEYKKDPFELIPVVLGHEGSGEIVKIGKNVKEDMLGKALSVGDKVITSVTVTGSDEFTRFQPEKSNLSNESDIYGLMSDDEYKFNGWFGDYIILRKGSSIFNVTGMSLEERLLVEPIAVTIHAVERAKTTGLLNFGTKVVVQGCGPIGLLVIAVLRTLGIENIIAVDGDNNRLTFAKKLGADTTINFKDYSSNSQMLEQIVKETNGGADFGFQCTGVPAAASSIYKMIRRGGGLCELGFFVDNGDATINPHYDLCQKELTVVGSWTYTFKDYKIALDFIKRAKGIGLPLEELITHRFKLEELEEAMAVNMRQEGIKVAYINK